MIPKVFFNYNPLSLYDPSSESVATAKELFEDAKTTPWTASALARNEKDAMRLAAALSELKEVEMTFTIADFIPGEQQKKLDIISDISLFMPEIPKDMQIDNSDCNETLNALNDIDSDLKLLALSEAGSPYYVSAGDLHESIGRFKKAIYNNQVHGERALKELEKGLLSDLPALLESLETSLQADTFKEADLPEELTGRFVSYDGRYRVQVFPSENITNIDALERFVTAVRTIAPNATDAPVVILETGKTIVASFKQATTFAMIFIALVLLIVLRSISGTVLILIPLLLSIIFTAAASVLLDIPFNYANVIVIPLLLGIGVDNGIHFIHRFRTEPPSNGNMLKTSTSRAMLFSSLTTVMSFSSLSFSSHSGIASMGKLLALCMGFLIVGTLIFLPALLEFYNRHFKKQVYS
jgi:hopanoid biosynthesis associated RND transporter like protein HpnN